MEQLLNQRKASTTATTRAAAEAGVFVRAAGLAAGDAVFTETAGLAAGDDVMSRAVATMNAGGGDVFGRAVNILNATGGARPASLEGKASPGAPTSRPEPELDPVSADIARRCALAAMKVHGVGPFARN
jgi:hypothetical protein